MGRRQRLFRLCKLAASPRTAGRGQAIQARLAFFADSSVPSVPNRRLPHLSPSLSNVAATGPTAVAKAAATRVRGCVQGRNRTIEPGQEESLNPDRIQPGNYQADCKAFQSGLGPGPHLCAYEAAPNNHSQQARAVPACPLSSKPTSLALQRAFISSSPKPRPMIDLSAIETSESHA